MTTYVNDKYGITEDGINFRFNNMDQRVINIRQQFGDPSYKKWVAEVGGKIVGYCGAERLPGTNHLGGFYIIEGYQSQGLGSQLIREALDWLGYQKPIKLGVAAFNEKAIRFYEKFGFKIKGNVSMSPPIAPNVPSFPEYEMIREIQ
jgi:ribosomal protein S18 acetylase RimI-like enzyme